MTEKELLYEKALCILKAIQKPKHIEVRRIIPLGDSRADIIENPDALFECDFYTGGLQVKLYNKKEYFSRRRNIFFSDKVARVHCELKIKLDSGSSFEFEEVYEDNSKIEKVVKELVRIQTIYLEDLDKRRLKALNSIECQ